MSRYYLDQLGLQHLYEVNKKDERYKKWKKFYKRYGIYPFECWNLNTTMLMLLYERVMFYKKLANPVVDLSFHKFTYKDKEFTQIELIEKIIKNCEYILDEKTYREWTKEEAIHQDQLEKEVWEIWSIISPDMWY